MNQFKRITVIVLLLFMILSFFYLSLRVVGNKLWPSQAFNDHHMHEKLLDYNEQISFIFELSNKFTVSEIGVINYPLYPEYKIYMVSYGNTELNNLKNYLFIAGIHGNERAPVYAMKDFIQYLDTIELLDGITIDFICLANPYGFEYNCRFNGPELDINRDLIRLQTLEAKYILESVEGRKYTGMFDFHESPRGTGSTGFYMFIYSERNRSLANNIIEMLQNHHVQIENEFVYYHIFKAKNGIIHLPWIVNMLTMHFGRMATTGLYFNNIKTEKVFVFETSMAQNLNDRWVTNLLVMKYLVGL